LVVGNEYSVYITYLLFNYAPVGIWSNGQRNGRPAKHTRRPLLNATECNQLPLLNAVP